MRGWPDCVTYQGSLLSLVLCEEDDGIGSTLAKHRLKKFA